MEHPVINKLIAMGRLILGFLWIVASSCAATLVPSSRLVNLEQGPVRGYKAPNNDIYVFYGVPYATAPTGYEKFKDPLPPPTWTEPLEAIDKGIICPQFNLYNTNRMMQEDCLIASIYVPARIKKKLPVVVYVHGGAYHVGYGDMLTPTALVSSQKIIGVTFNYRLGLPGFLCLGTPDIPGNSGIKDQVALLRWVKNNIEQFGGDADDITIAGYSAGGSSVDLLMLSKTTAGLFNKAIPESGSNLAAFSIQRDPIKNAKEYARLLNFTNVDDIQALESFYKKASIEQLTSITSEILNRPDSTFLFSPCIERDTGTEMFLDNDPLNILKSGDYQKLPILYGFANMEGLFRINVFEIWKNHMNENFSNFLPADLQFQSDEEKQNVANKIKEFYFGKKSISEETVLDYIDYFSDVLFATPILRSLRLQGESGNNNIYLYEYSFVDYNTPLVPFTNIRGAEHCAQSAAVLNSESNDSENTSEEYEKFKVVMRKLWLNFITTGKPVLNESPLPTWSSADVDGNPYMLLNQTSQLKYSPLLYRRAQLWEDIYDQYYRHPVPPTP